MYMLQMIVKASNSHKKLYSKTPHQFTEHCVTEILGAMMMELRTY